ncbi:MAG: hypothetical protein ACI8S6_005670, partial [Myxococcota bacterium]
ERLAQGQAALSAVACLDDWADPPLAAQIHQLAAQLAGEEDDPATATAHVLGMRRALALPEGTPVRLLPDRGACLWRVDGWPADGGLWQATPEAAALLQRRCTDATLQTWLLPDDRIPAEALTIGGPWPVAAAPLVLDISPMPPVEMMTPLAERGPLTGGQRRLLRLSAGAGAASIASLTAAAILRARFRSGEGDADTLVVWNGATASVGYSAAVASVGLLLRFEDVRRADR